jgi:hypothetical protein
MGLSLKEKKAVTGQIRSRRRKAKRKENSSIPNECIQVTGYNRKYASGSAGPPRRQRQGAQSPEKKTRPPEG